MGAETDGGGGEPPAAARLVKLSATAMSRGSYVAVLLEERYTVTMLPAELAKDRLNTKTDCLEQDAVTYKSVYIGLMVFVIPMH